MFTPKNDAYIPHTPPYSTQDPIQPSDFYDYLLGKLDEAATVYGAFYECAYHLTHKELQVSAVEKINAELLDLSKAVSDMKEHCLILSASRFDCLQEEASHE